MSKAEELFEKVDFSLETDLKDRLRNQLFKNGGESASRQDAMHGNREKGGRKGSVRKLDFEELEYVNAAGNTAMQEGPALGVNTGHTQDLKKRYAGAVSLFGNMADPNIAVQNMADHDTEKQKPN